MQTVFDVTKGADYRAAFDLIPESRVKAILSTNWSGQMFSQRVWDNTNALADGLKHDMLVGIMAGKSEQHMADDIMNRCGVGAFEARRLVRTETTCVANMAELYGYKELDIDEYEFSACLDSRTSDLCRELDGKVFKRNSAQAGVNLPPMHPFCRSTTLPVLPSEEDLDKELAELGDEIGADVDFDEWEQNLQQGEDGKWRYVAGSAGKVKANKPMRFAGNGVDKSKKNGIINNRKLSISDRILEWNDEDKILEYSPDEVEAELLKRYATEGEWQNTTIKDQGKDPTTLDGVGTLYASDGSWSQKVKEHLLNIFKDKVDISKDDEDYSVIDYNNKLKNMEFLKYSQMEEQLNNPYATEEQLKNYYSINKEGKIKKMGPRDQFGLLSKDDKVKFRDEYLLMTGMPYPTFYQKLQNDGFRPLELRAFNEMIQCYISNHNN